VPSVKPALLYLLASYRLQEAKQALILSFHFTLCALHFGASVAKITKTTVSVRLAQCRSLYYTILVPLEALYLFYQLDAAVNLCAII